MLRKDFLIIMRAKNQYLKNCVIASVLYGVPFILVCLVLFGDFFKAFILGVSGGILFGIATTLFILFYSKKMEPIRQEIKRNHTIIFEGAGNHWEGKGSNGGWIFLTEDCLNFIPHKINFNTNRILIPYKDMESVSKASKIKTIEIFCKSGSKEKFVVNERKKWIHILNEIISKEHEEASYIDDRK